MRDGREVDSGAPLAGVAFLDAWRRELRPLPGSVPPVAGFDPGAIASTSTSTSMSTAASSVAAGDAVGDVVGEAVSVAVAAATGLAGVDVAGLGAGALSDLAQGAEQVRRMLEAVSARIAGRVDDANPFREQGYFNAKTFLKQRLQLSGAEAFRRVQVAHLHDELPDWAAAQADGRVGVAQCELMARVVANPRVGRDVLRRDAGMLLDDAMTLPYADFERNVRTWEALADPDGDRDRNERQKAARDVSLRPRPEGGWALTGMLPELDGAEFVEIWGRFVEAEWQADWADARTRLGDAASPTDLQRTEAQRRADALVVMGRAAVANTTAPGVTPRPTVDVLVDHDSLETWLAGGSPSPTRYRNVVCRTRSGRRLHPDDAVNAALIGHIRRVVYDASGTVIDLGRRSRLFRGSAREAVMLLLTTCVWVGCDRPVHWCDADHSTGWAAHGATVPRQGQPLCHGHNLLEERGLRVYRDNHGHWHIIDPRGNPVV